MRPADWDRKRCILIGRNRSKSRTPKSFEKMRLAPSLQTVSVFLFRKEGRPKCIWQIQHQRRAILTAFAASWPNRAVSPGDTRSPVTARLDQVRPFRRPHIRWFCRADSSQPTSCFQPDLLLVHQVIYLYSYRYRCIRFLDRALRALKAANLLL